jgi:hypothetical protein
MRGKQKSRFTATGQLLEYLQSNPEQLLKKSWGNEVLNATHNPTQASWIHHRVPLTQYNIYSLAYTFVLLLLEWQVDYSGTQASAT